MRGLIFFLLILAGLPAFAADAVDCYPVPPSDFVYINSMYRNLNFIVDKASPSSRDDDPVSAPVTMDILGSGELPTLCTPVNYGKDGMLTVLKTSYCGSHQTIKVGTVSGKNWNLEYGLGLNTNFNMQPDIPAMLYQGWSIDHNFYLHYQYQY